MTDETRDQFRGLGANVPESQDETSEDEIEVWRENWPIVDVFLALETQWRCVVVAGLGAGKTVWQGLDYAAADVVLRRFGFKSGRKAFDRLMVMEDAALTILNGAG